MGKLLANFKNILEQLLLKTLMKLGKFWENSLKASNNFWKMIKVM